jgi:putative Holliday junction resolvase
MGRIMAIDFGTKRMGIAVTDPMKLIANGLTTVDSKQIMNFLEDYFKKEDVECMVIGNPNSNGKGGDMTKLANDFCVRLKEKFPSMKIDRIDEFYTSKLAQRTIISSGINKTARREKGLVDKISATIILQNYLDKI